VADQSDRLLRQIIVMRQCGCLGARQAESRPDSPLDRLRLGLVMRRFAVSMGFVLVRRGGAGHAGGENCANEKEAGATAKLACAVRSVAGSNNRPMCAEVENGNAPTSPCLDSKHARCDAGSQEVDLQRLLNLKVCCVSDALVS
jgi:hypothetical protein